jgi:dTMP kinase
MAGKLIVIEGLDGAGKSTQFERLLTHYKAQNKEIVGISFPNYEEDSSALVKMYLHGQIGEDANKINPYAASSFYSVDRFAAYKRHWEKDYLAGRSVLASRYTTSNIIYQMNKCPKDKWDNYIDWLYDFEFNKMGLPKPDLVIFLEVPLSVSEKLLSKRYEGDDSKKDIHEKNKSFMKSCYESAHYAAKKLNWKVIDCTKDGQMRSIEEILADLIKTVDEVL